MHVICGRGVPSHIQPTTHAQQDHLSKERGGFHSKSSHSSSRISSNRPKNALSIWINMKSIHLQPCIFLSKKGTRQGILRVSNQWLLALIHSLKFCLQIVTSARVEDRFCARNCTRDEEANRTLWTASSPALELNSFEISVWRHEASSCSSSILVRASL